MFNLYIGNKYKHIRLNNGYILKTELSSNINEPLTLKLTVNIKELYRTQSRELVNYIIGYDSSLYLESKDLNIGYKFTKKHNQVQEIKAIGKEGEKFVILNGNENLNSTNLTFSKNSSNTTNGVSKHILNNQIVNQEFLTEFRIFSDVKGSENMALQIFDEKLSISGQVLENNIIELTFLSTLNLVNFKNSNLVYGQIYNTTLSNLVKDLCPDFIVDCQVNKTIQYIVELKQNLEILQDICKGYTIIDNGYDIATNKPKLLIIDINSQIPKIRLVSQQYAGNNPHVLLVKENYPSISAQVMFNGTYLREGTRCLLDYNTLHTRYRGQFNIKGTTIDLLYGYSGEANVQLLESNQDIRTNYLEKNLQTLSNRLL